MNQSNSDKSNKSSGAFEAQPGSAREAWDCPQLIPLDLGSAQAKFCMFGTEIAPDNGPLMVGCS